MTLLFEQRSAAECVLLSNPKVLVDAVHAETKIEDCLERHRHSLRKALADSVGVNCPELKFLPDRSKLMEEEMERLFRIADYGMDYRACSFFVMNLLGEECETERRTLNDSSPLRFRILAEVTRMLNRNLTVNH
ncbi:hypothetical protein TELCIR_01995 [Teladorsagia circumcincta]|uniref:Uncharacterized protein n=1 Tax=Teladorsagia circumcincta TaxID=45464 RepID=A0A2G9V1W0_TELCI|nr:hypothetical protein TELCIR_01995 [Teladorsagia circumcincta]